ncbi:carbohydrate sulfotransferase 4-like [Oculina patagonica]
MLSCFRFSCHGNRTLLYVLFICSLGAFLVICVEVNILLQIHPQELKEEHEVKTLQKRVESDISTTNYQSELDPVTKLLPKGKKRLNVIILTHMGSGSTFFGNVFNLHPDVFYLYEPLLNLRRKVYGDDWHQLNETANEAYKIDSATLLRDLFTCGFKEEKTLPRIFPQFLKVPERLHFMYWRMSTPELTNEGVRDACLAKRITVAKIMQTRLPRDGLQELERFCSSDPEWFDCLIIHLVRDPRAVLSSLLRRKFFFKDSKRQLFDDSENLTPEATEIVKHNAKLLCSQVVDNLNYVKEFGSHGLQGRYKLLRYEDIVNNAPLIVDKMYKFVGLPMVDDIKKWIEEGTPLVNTTGTQFSENDASRVNSWRTDRDPSLVSLFEEACAPLMKLMGYISVNDTGHAQYNDSKPLITTDIPLLKDLPFN